MLDVLADPVAVEALVHGHARDPFALLGPHQDGDGFVVRTLQPGAEAVQIVARADGAVLADAERTHQGGLFAAHLAELPPYMLRIHWGGNAIQETEDPYSFGLQLGDVDLHLLAEGTHRDIAACLGAHVLSVDGVRGVRFAVWAPNAQRVSVVGDFNTWDGRRHPMRLRFGAGIWELFIPRLEPGTVYKYEIIGAYGHVLPLKADPVAQAAELPPRTASVVADPAPPRWTDDAWMAGRAARQTEHSPIAIYEVHAGSWMRDEHGRPLQWDALADRLIPYARGLGFTHIELLPVTEHPFGGSWGYQPLGLFAPASTFGTPQAFAAFVDRCHEAELGVILDWVPAHFPTDAHGMAQFDGTALYEHQDPREGFHRDWNTLIYNLGRNEVRGFLIASALHFLEHYHIDGLRVDAVASMLYRDYSRNPGEWVPNIYGGRENLEAVSFLQELSRTVALRCPSAVLIAEESTAWPGVTRPADEGGLGFRFKWNMGWMHDTLHYMGEESINRSWHHDELTFGLVYAFSEKFILPLSHDEVVHGKGSLIAKMRGDDWQKFANLRAYLGFMWGHPGKKLIFMGIELAQWSEWNHDAEVEWYRQDQPWHRGIQYLVRDLNRLHVGEPALHRRDCAPSGFRWIIGDDRAQSVFAFVRSGEEGDPPVLVVCNFTPVPRHDYRVGVPSAGWWQEILNTDADLYAGSGVGNAGGAMAEAVADHGEPASLVLTLPPLATIMFRRAH